MTRFDRRPEPQPRPAAMSADTMFANITRSRLVIAGLSTAMMALSLAGCREFYHPEGLAAVELNDPDKRHAIHLSSRPETLLVEVGHDGTGLTANQESDVLAFIHRYKAESRGKLRIASPAGGSSRAVRHVRSLAEESGLPPWAIEVSSIRGEGRRRQAMKLTYERVVAIPPACGDWSEDVGRDHQRLHYPNFGCATQNNLAVMVAHPRDLERPQDETPRSSERRSSDWAKYSSGGGGGAAPVATTQQATPGDSAGKGAPAKK